MYKRNYKRSYQPTSRPSRQKEVTDKIIASLREGVAPWTKPWETNPLGVVPKNGSTRKPYHGGNVINLWFAQSEGKFSSPYWVTFKQALELGGNVKKGEHSIAWIASFGSYRKVGENGEESLGKYAKASSVFNVEQCEGLKPDLYYTPAPKTDHQRREDVEAYIANLGAVVDHHGEKAFYSHSADKIVLPVFEAFNTPEDYYASSLHEHAHWTGHESRLKRDLTGKRKSESYAKEELIAYAKEELIAELASAFLCASLQIEGKMQHAEYLGSWIQILEADERAIYAAASAAAKVQEYLDSLQGVETENDEEGDE